MRIAIAERLLRRVIGTGPLAEAALGDLLEELAAKKKVLPAWKATLWLVREASSLGWAFVRAPRLRHAKAPADRRKGDPIMRVLADDVRYAVRGLAQKPLFTALVVATLALGIGGNVALWSVVDGVLLRPLPYAEPDRIVVVWENDRLRGTQKEPASLPDYRDFLERNRSFSLLAGRMRADRTLGTQAEPVRVSSAQVTAGYFPLLGVRPVIGRAFTDEDGRPGQEGVLLLAEGLWRERFASDPRVLGQKVLLDGEPRTLVGVMPAEARLPGSGDQVFEPLAIGPTDGFRGMHNLTVFARLGPSATLASAQADMAGIMKHLEEEYADDNQGRGAWVRPLQEEVVGDSRPALLLLFGAVGLLLLMACASVANLVLTRGVGRERELAIRSSLGAGPMRLFRQLLTENLLLAGLGGAAGVLVGALLLRLLRVLGPELPRLDEVAIDARALAFALTASVASAVVFGVIPALRAARRRPQAGLQEGGRVSGHGSLRARRALAAFELVAAVVLVAGAGLLVRSFWNLHQIDPGFDARSLLVAKLSLAGPGYAFPKGWPVNDWPTQRAFTSSLEERLAEAPGVRHVAFAHQGPTDPGWTTRVTVAGRPAPAPGVQEEASFRPVSAGYFQTLRVPVRRGREFSSADAPGRPLVAVVNEAFAARHFPGEDPLGRSIEVFGRAREIVGLVGNERFHGLEAGPAPAMYMPLDQNPMPALSVLMRTDAEPLDQAPVLREAVRRVDPALALFEMTSGERALASSLEERRFTLLLLFAFAAVAMTLAAVGIYGVVSYAVSERTREMGVRIALGAEPRQVFRLVVGHGLRLSILAIAVGLGLALMAGRVMEGMLFGVRARDPLTFALVGTLLLVTAFAACALPARRATRTDPVTALRSE